MANIKQDTIKKLEHLGYTAWLMNEHMTIVERPEWATHLGLVNWSENLNFTVKLPKKKEVTFEWITPKLVKGKSDYQNLAKLFQKLLNSNNHCVYPTSYGIGFYSLLGRDEESLNRLTTVLNENNIKFKNEYSEAGWVYRFVISKSKENVNKVEQLISEGVK